MERKKADVWALIANGYQALQDAFGEARIHNKYNRAHRRIYRTEFNMALEMLRTHPPLAQAMIDDIIADYVKQSGSLERKFRREFLPAPAMMLRFAELGASPVLIQALTLIVEHIHPRIAQKIGRLFPDS